MKQFLNTLLLFSLTLIASNQSFAQEFEWLITAGGAKSDKGTTIVADADGNTYITGYYNEEANFGSINTGFSFASSKEVYVAKIDPDGNYLWVRNGLNYYDDRGLGLCLDSMGNVYVTGTCWGSITFGSLYATPTNNDYTDQIFLLKLDNDGNEIWIKNAGNDDGTVSSGTNENGLPQTLYQDDHGQDLASDSEGNVYVTGFLSNISDVPQIAYFDAIHVPLTPQDSVAFIAKIDNDGNWQWVETFQGIYEHRDNAITVDDDDNIYVVGGFFGNADFQGQSIMSSGKTDIYVTKWDPDGNMLWVSQAGSTKGDRANDIAYGHDGYMYITGEFRDSSYFGSTLLDNYGGGSGRDIFIAKMSKDGEWIWANQAGSNKGSDRGNDIVANKQGNIFVTGQFSGDAQFGALSAASNGDSVTIFAAAFDGGGEWRWLKTAGGPRYDRGAGIATNEGCDVWVHGYFQDSIAAGDFVETPYPGTETFTFKLSDACFGDVVEDPEPDEEQCKLLNSNVITANDDNVNDILYFAEDCNIEISATIINRWGNVVFETNDSNVGWDGKDKNGVLLTEGVYFYRVETKFEIFPDEELSGFVHLIH